MGGGLNWKSGRVRGKMGKREGREKKSEEEKEIWKRQSCKLHPNYIHTNPKQVLQKVCKVLNTGK